MPGFLRPGAGTCTASVMIRRLGLTRCTAPSPGLYRSGSTAFDEHGGSFPF